MSTVATFAQTQPPTTPPAPTQAQVDELRALVISLQVRLTETERKLGEEIARRAALEQEKLRDSVKLLDPAVRKLLGVPVQSEAPTTQSKPEDKPKPVAEPPKS
jgi:hypothetical protein